MKGPPLTAPRQTTLNAALAAAAQGADGLTFVHGDQSETTLPWQEVRERARCCAAGLLEAGILPGDRVALVLPTSPAFVTAFFGVLMARAVPVPLYPPVRLGRLQEYQLATAAMVCAAEARMILSEGMILRLLNEAVARSRPPLGCRSVESLHGATEGPLEAPAPADLALVQFSSGTTRTPRPVALTHAAITAQCEALRPLLGDQEGAQQRGVSWLPLYHDMGLIGALLSAVTYPGPLILIPPERFLANPAIWLQTISRHRATISPAPPFAFALCARKVGDEQLNGCDLSSWRLAICGAEPIQPALLERFTTRFAPYGFRAEALAPAYGLAEAALAVTCTPPAEGPSDLSVHSGWLRCGQEIRPGERRIACVGSPLAGVEIAIRDDDGRPLSAGRCGRIWVRGPSLMRGYLGLSEETAAVLRDGWLDTGDLGFLKNERLYVVGRAKNIIIIRGANHWPEEFENCLAGIAGLRPGRALAAGYLPPDAAGEELILLAERSRGVRPANDPELASLIRQAILERTGVHPHNVVLLAPGTLLRTSSGKLRRAESLRQYLAGELKEPRGHPVMSAVGQLIRSTMGFLRAWGSG